MEIENIALTKLRNEEHYKLQTDFKGLIEKHTPSALGIEPLYATYLPLYANEHEALDKIKASAVTLELADADALRDNIYSGICDAVKSANKHFRAEVKAAAARLQIVLNNYGNVAIRPYDEETAAIIKFVAELQSTYAADVTTVGLTEWITELKTLNEAFDTLKKNRYSETTSKTQLTMKEVRTEIDAAYKAIVKRINALIEVNGATAYNPFVKDLNARIESYSLNIAQRKGRNEKDDDTATTTTTTTETK